MIYAYLANHGHHYEQETGFSRHVQRDSSRSGMFGHLQAFPSVAIMQDDADDQECHYERIPRQQLVSDFGRKVVADMREKAAAYWA